VPTTEVNILIAFVFGALSFVSPCVLPLLPGYVSLMSGYSAKELEAGEASLKKVTGATLLFVLGFTAVFVALGAGATSVGEFFLRNQSTATRIAGWFIVAMGLFIAATAVWNINLFMGLMRERRLDVRPSRLGNWAPPVMGVAFGFGWTPCIGPVLGAILTLAASEETVGRGMLLLFSYSMGLGVPFLAASLGITKAFSAFRWFRQYIKPVNIASGLLLAGFGVLMVTGQISAISRWFTEVLVNLGLDGLATI